MLLRHGWKWLLGKWRFCKREEFRAPPNTLPPQTLVPPCLFSFQTPCLVELPPIQPGSMWTEEANRVQIQADDPSTRIIENLVQIPLSLVSELVPWITILSEVFFFFFFPLFWCSKLQFWHLVSDVKTSYSPDWFRVWCRPFQMFKTCFAEMRTLQASLMAISLCSAVSCCGAEHL